MLLHCPSLPHTSCWNGHAGHFSSPRQGYNQLQKDQTDQRQQNTGRVRASVKQFTESKRKFSLLRAVTKHWAEAATELQISYLWHHSSNSSSGPLHLPTVLPVRVMLQNMAASKRGEGQARNHSQIPHGS